MNDRNPYIPSRAVILEVIQETRSNTQDVKTFRLKLDEPFDYRPGQFVEFSVAGVGECTFGFASSPLIKDYTELTIKRAGRVTEHIHMLGEGSVVWIRGPFGNAFPLERMEGSDLFYVTGGLGLAPLRPMIDCVFDPANRGKYGRINMLTAARSPGDFIFSYDFEKWAHMPDTGFYQTIDAEVEGWDKLVGFPHTLLDRIPFDLKRTFALLCGPPPMIKALSNAFVEYGVSPEKIYTTLEMRMTCGVGKCGKCNIGRRYVCIDGPVFSMAELGAMPGEY
ncbi:MAG: FAD/NAD(P)-binding protein [Clostridiales Family XIII bacterium]|jgi:NAD(P)H-flavin reductase|nr:FAD/NAD(P)-binding protein [Clostridiales Family XIII bacterium]